MRHPLNLKSLCKVKMKYCSPKRITQLQKGQENTCLTLKELQLIAKDFNRTINKEVIKLNQSKTKLYEAIRKELESYCGQHHNHDYCWIEQPFVSPSTKSMIVDAFRPKKPIDWYKDRYTWLNTFDILDVMKQYENNYRSFKFLGVFPIDFQETYPSSHNVCIGRNMCQFDIMKHVLNENKTCFAVVLNHDRHDQPGSHWVSIFGNLNPKDINYGVYYYDSVASSAPTQVHHFMNDVAQQVKANSISSKREFEVAYNNIQKQTKNTECGVFCMIFLTQMLRNMHPFLVICQHMRKDDGMNQIRDVIYRPSVFQ